MGDLMPEFGRSSRKNLATAHPDLQRLFNEVIKEFDCSVICGHRGKADQDKAVANGKSDAKWPTGKHNKIPSLACDVVPYPVDFDDIPRFYVMANIVKATAKRLNIRVKWGGDFKATKTREAGWDKPHWELI
jgi:peptidoglycan LD-endopeptidase CwlK